MPNLDEALLLRIAAQRLRHNGLQGENVPLFPQQQPECLVTGVEIVSRGRRTSLIRSCSP